MERFSKLSAVLALALGSVWGQAQPNYDPGQQPGPNPEQTRPDQGVARLSLMNGEVSVRRGDSGDVMAAVMNAPLMIQDAILTSSSSRAEIQFDAANLVRIAANSELRIADLQYGHAQLQLALGTITLRVLRNSQNQIEIDLPAVGFRPSGPGVYRVTVREDGTGDITVREGGGQVLTQGGTETLQAGYRMMVRGAGQDAEYQVVSAPAVDDWDRWNQQRDASFLQSRSSRYVSPDVYGTENLDQNGRWVQDPTYGNVWTPNVPPGWAPYQAGQWVWEDYYGWTWVSTDPWGWAPYHYGRWFYGPVGWCWYPGALFGPRYWSPALVGFFGFGGFRAGIGFGFGSIGWVALAPFEAMHAWWGHGYGRGAAFNNAIVHNTVITNVYRNARAANGVTAVGAGDFGRRTASFQRMSGSQVQGAGLVRGGLPVAPNRSSLSFSNRTVSAARFPQTANRSFFGHTAGATQRTSFEQTQRNFTAPAARTSTGGGGWERFNGPSTAGRPAASGGGWNSAPRTTYQAPRPAWGNSGGQAVRISPPIVRSYSNGGGGNSGASGTRGASAPAARSTSSSRASGSGASHASAGGHSSGSGGHHR
jgi:hypothetical protein